MILARIDAKLNDSIASPKTLGLDLGSPFNPTFPEAGLRPGTGFKPAFPDDVLIRIRSSPVLGGTRTGDVYERLEQSDSYAVEARSFNVSASAAFDFLSGGIRLDGSYSHAVEVAEKVNSYLWRLVIWDSSGFGEYSPRIDDLDRYVKNLLSDGKVQRFEQVYGSCYVNKVYYGRQLELNVRIEDRGRTSKSSVERALSIALRYLKASVEVKAADREKVETATRNLQMTIQVNSLGGPTVSLLKGTFGPMPAIEKLDAISKFASGWAEAPIDRKVDILGYDVLPYKTTLAELYDKDKAKYSLDDFDNRNAVIEKLYLEFIQSARILARIEKQLRRKSASSDSRFLFNIQEFFFQWQEVLQGQALAILEERPAAPMTEADLVRREKEKASTLRKVLKSGVRWSLESCAAKPSLATELRSLVGVMPGLSQLVVDDRPSVDLQGSCPCKSGEIRPDYQKVLVPRLSQVLFRPRLESEFPDELLVRLTGLEFSATKPSPGNGGDSPCPFFQIILDLKVNGTQVMLPVEATTLVVRNPGFGVHKLENYGLRFHVYEFPVVDLNEIQAIQFGLTVQAAQDQKGTPLKNVDGSTDVVAIYTPLPEYERETLLTAFNTKGLELSWVANSGGFGEFNGTIKVAEA